MLALFKAGSETDARSAFVHGTCMVHQWPSRCPFCPSVVQFRSWVTLGLGDTIVISP